MVPEIEDSVAQAPLDPDAQERVDRTVALAKVGECVVARFDAFGGKIPVRMIAREDGTEGPPDCIVATLNIAIPLASFQALGWEPVWHDANGKPIAG